jgi:hypothetical protein
LRVRIPRGDGGNVSKNWFVGGRVGRGRRDRPGRRRFDGTGEHVGGARVVDVRGGNVTGYWVKYVARMSQEATGWLVPLRGGAKLSITLPVSAYNDAGEDTYNFANRRELVNVSGYRTFRQVAWAGSFEATTSVGLGLRARLPFRVFTLPGRLVVDVAHNW